MGAHKFWRCSNLTTRLMPVSGFTCAELQFLDATGSNLCSGGVPFASSEWGSYGGRNPPAVAGSAFDSNPSTFFENSTSTVIEQYGVSATWLGYQFVSSVLPVSIAVSMRSDMQSTWGQEWRYVQIDYSDDGITWAGYGAAIFSMAYGDATLTQSPILVFNSYAISGVCGAFFGASPPASAGVIALKGLMGTRNIYQGGAGFVAGNVKELPKGALSGNEVPVWRRVQLIDEQTRLLVAETWSDPVTGVFRFDNVATGCSYTILSYDHNGVFRAVVADRVAAVGYTS